MDFGKPGCEDTIRLMYGSIAHRYDLLNNILTLNQVNHWRRFAASRSGLRPGGYGLDVACGTGLLTLELAGIVGETGRVIGIDFCEQMLDRAGVNLEGTPWNDVIQFIPGHASDLPFPDSTFDCATIGFALRVVPDIEQTISEMIRVVKPGGKVVNLELAKPGIPVFKQVYSLYFNRLVPLIGQLGVGFKGPYEFLAHSLDDFPHQAEILELFQRLGLTDVKYHELTGGVVGVHAGTKCWPA